jgi:hypothetical protein
MESFSKLKSLMEMLMKEEKKGLKKGKQYTPCGRCLSSDMDNHK